MDKLEKFLGALTVAGMCMIPKAYAQTPIDPAELPMILRGSITYAAAGYSVFVFNKKDDSLVGKTAVFYDNVSQNNVYNTLIETDKAFTSQIEGPVAGDELYCKIKRILDGRRYELSGNQITHQPGQIIVEDFNVGTDVNEYLDWFEVKNKYR